MFLSEGAMDVTSALSTGTKLFNWVIECISSNPVLTGVFVVTVLVPAGILVFSRLKNAIAH